MPGKKKKKKGKAKDKKGDNGLPPPPNVDDTRQGALEALLSYRIFGKEDIIDQYEEDSGHLRDINDKQKQENHSLRVRKGDYYKTMVQQAKTLKEARDNSPYVHKEEVEEALAEKIALTQKIKEDVQKTEERIERTGALLEESMVELNKWLHFKDITQHKNSTYISTMLQGMKKMEGDLEVLQNDCGTALAKTTAAVEQRAAMLAEKEHVSAAQQIMANMDRDSKSELVDNMWLKQQIALMKKIAVSLTAEVNAAEKQNLEFIEALYKRRMLKMEGTKEDFLASIRKSSAVVGLKRTNDEGSGLPSLVNVASCTSERKSSGQASLLERSMLYSRGHRAQFSAPPDIIHLPPVEQQKIGHSGLPSCTNWPVSKSMLKVLVKSNS